MNYEIRHWGIKDQKWGRRRYQNPDGSYTEEGKARRRKDYTPYSEWSEDAKEFAKLSRKDPQTMTTKELTTFNTRKSQLDNYKKSNPGDLAAYIAAGLAGVAAITGAISTVNNLLTTSSNLGRNGEAFINKFTKKEA